MIDNLLAAIHAMVNLGDRSKKLWVVVRGGGDLASGVALRLHRAGLRLIITELPEPLVVRRAVAFAEAIYSSEAYVEGVLARRVAGVEEAGQCFDHNVVPVMVDPDLTVLETLKRQGSLQVLVDARMTKQPVAMKLDMADLIIGLGPGFTPQVNCHAAIETNRGHFLGRVLWNEPPETDTGIPDRVRGKADERVLRAPVEGRVRSIMQIGMHVQEGELVAEVDGYPVPARSDGVLRGLVRDGLQVPRGLKIGDIDPRNDPRFCFLVSDKSLAMGGGVLEAILSQPGLRLYGFDPCR